MVTDWREIWIFVRIIDNYGDAGVAWRLARQLAARFGSSVTLWADDTDVVGKLAGADILTGVAIRPWTDDGCFCPELPDPDCVIEMFGCTLPDAVRRRIADCRPLWLNWEYLSAEDWVDTVHTLPSLQPDGSAKYFWCMGFSVGSGGLLREADYESKKQAFLQNKAEQRNFLHGCGLPEKNEAEHIFLFAYEASVWPEVLQQRLESGREAVIWLAGGEVAAVWRRAGLIGEYDLQTAGDSVSIGCVRAYRLPFVPQAQFDRFLWLCDTAVVRGEDSFVRAQWAGMPFFWHIYPQEEQAHLVKLAAFNARYTREWPEALQKAYCLLSSALNGEGRVAETEPAGDLLQNAGRNEWERQAAAWSGVLAEAPDTLEKLAGFCRDTLE